MLQLKTLLSYHEQEAVVSATVQKKGRVSIDVVVQLGGTLETQYCLYASLFCKPMCLKFPKFHCFIMLDVVQIQ